MIDTRKPSREKKGGGFLMERREREDFSFEVESQPKVFAFDLSLEWQRLHEPAPQGKDPAFIEEVRKRRFFENAVCYAKEALGVSFAQYPPYQIVKESGQLTLYADGYEGPVRELYNPDFFNPNLPWPEYRLKGVNYQRAKIEYQTFCAFEQSRELARAQEGDLFVWISMPPTEILMAEMPYEAKKKALEDLGYGFHTNTFVLQVAQGSLEGRVVQNFLPAKYQAEFLRRITGRDWFQETPTDSELLGLIVKVEDPAILSAEEIRKVIEEIEAEMPEEEKIKLPKEDNRLLSEKQVEEALHQTRHLLEQTFYLLWFLGREELGEGTVQELVERRFKAWENLVASLVKGEETDLSKVGGLTKEEIKFWALSEIEEIRRREEVLTKEEGRVLDNQLFPQGREFLAISLWVDEQAQRGVGFGATGCGIGAGFGRGDFGLEMNLGLSENPLNFAFTYQSATLLAKEKEPFVCPKCHFKTYERVGNRCPSCGLTKEQFIKEAKEKGIAICA